MELTVHKLTIAYLMNENYIEDVAMLCKYVIFWHLQTFTLKLGNIGGKRVYPTKKAPLVLQRSRNGFIRASSKLSSSPRV